MMMTILIEEYEGEELISSFEYKPDQNKRNVKGDFFRQLALDYYEYLIRMAGASEEEVACCIKKGSYINKNYKVIMREPK